MVPNIGVPLELDLGPLLPHHVSEIVVGILLMLVIWAAMAKLVVPKFEALYKERSDAIEGGMKRAEQAELAAAAALAQYNDQLASARTEAAQIREAAKTQAATIVAESRDAAQKESARISEVAHAQIEADKAKASAALKSEVGSLATVLAGKIIGEALTDDERSRRTVDRFLDELDSQAVSQQ